jgi:hypothetical protein
VTRDFRPWALFKSNGDEWGTFVIKSDGKPDEEIISVVSLRTPAAIEG